MAGTRSVSFIQVRKAAAVYMALPLFCFLGGFLRWYYAIFSCAVLGVLLWLVIRSRNLEADCNGQSTFSYRTVAFVFALSMLWSYLGGMNGYFYQSSDWGYRNAIYFDLIQYPWPVIYDRSGQALVYYIGHWLPPAALAKAVQYLSGSVEQGRMAGRMFLWLWSSAGLAVIFLMVFPLVGAFTRKKRIVAGLILIFFSGLDLVGGIILQRMESLMDPGVLHLEWWCTEYQYSSITTCLFWVFNQTIIPWVITLCFFSERDPRNYIFYCVVCLLCGTLPCIGLVMLMIVKAAVYCLKEARRKNAREIPRTVFSAQNLLALFVVFPLVAAFILTSNIVGLPGIAAPIPAEQAAQGAEAVQTRSAEEDFSRRSALERLSDTSGEESAKEESDSGSKLNLSDTLRYRLRYTVYKLKRFVLYDLKPFALFFVLDAGLYLLCIFPDHRKDPMFYALFFSLLLIPNIHVGHSIDFCMRASVPGLFILMLYVNRLLLAYFPTDRAKAQGASKGAWKKRAAAVTLAVCFVIGAMTPVVEFYRGIYHVTKKGTFYLEDRSVITLNRDEGTGDNFVCSHPEEHFFFRYLAR